MNELKPCPFCGANAQIQGNSVYCETPFCIGYPMQAEKWNTRAPAPPSDSGETCEWREFAPGKYVSCAGREFSFIPGPYCPDCAKSMIYHRFNPHSPSPTEAEPELDVNGPPSPMPTYEEMTEAALREIMGKIEALRKEAERGQEVRTNIQAHFNGGRGSAFNDSLRIIRSHLPGVTNSAERGKG
jgi:hypothetical protein